MQINVRHLVIGIRRYILHVAATHAALGFRYCGKLSGGNEQECRLDLRVRSMKPDTSSVLLFPLLPAQHYMPTVIEPFFFTPVFLIL